MQFDANAGAHLKGRVMWAVINDDGSVADEGTLFPKKPFNNLILDQGIDNIGNQSLASLFENCAIGTGTSTPATTQVELDNEHARTNNYVGNLCGTTFPADGASPFTIVMERGWDFPKGSLDSSVDGDYAEMGFSHVSAAGTNLFSRTLIKDDTGTNTTVSVASDQILRVSYELSVTLEPSSIRTGSVSVTNIGTVTYQAIGGALKNDFSGGHESISRVISDGSTSFSAYNAVGMFEPSALFNNGIACSLTSDDNATFTGFMWNSLTDEILNVSGTNTYTLTYAGSGVWDIQLSFSTNQGNTSGVKNILLGWSNDDRYTGASYPMRFRIDDGSEFTKENTHELTLNFQLTYTAN